MKILHITTHLGGGVGTVLLNYFAKVKDHHVVVCLDYANQRAKETAKRSKLTLLDEMASRPDEICDMVSDSDIVLIHWWPHPMLKEFMSHTILPSSRVIIWSHQSGLYPPNEFTEELLAYPDMFVFSSPISYASEVVQRYKHKGKLDVICSTGGVKHLGEVTRKQHDSFNIGYIGTVSYKKMHPEFIKICSKVNIPNVHFTVCGVPDAEKMKIEADQLGVGDEFTFTGRILDIKQYLSIFDIFGYPLAPYHYGACDQVLQEAMVAGVVPVVLANPMEQQMVKDGQTGIVATDTNAYIKALEMLYRNPILRQALSQIARHNALHTFSLDKMIQEWDRVFKRVMKNGEKCVRNTLKEEK